MCGIFGCIGTVKCFDYGIYGLEQLRNRGYDSAGCCAIDSNNELILRKYATIDSKDSIDMLKDCHIDFKECVNGIFHTRWATHGSKTDNNAHPHLDNKNRIALVHNGIIENYYELKLELETKYNIVFRSQTDTEVIVNLISVYYDIVNENNERHMEQAIMKAVLRLQGTWGLVILNKEKPDNLYCVRHGSPLLLGFGGSYIIVTSEQAGFGHNVNNYICLENDDITVIRRRHNKVNFEKLDNYELKNISTQLSELTPEPYQNWTIKEIHEQYEASIRAISFGGRITDDNKVVLGGPNQYKKQLKNVEHLLLLGCGTSLNAGIHGTFFFKELCSFTTVMAIDGSEFTQYDIPKRGKTCAIFLSQSGETKDLYRCLNICRDNDIITIGVINVVDSLISREVDCGCYLNAGREVGVASTKAFTSQVILLSMLAIFFAQIHNINESKIKNYIKCLRQLPTDIRKIVSNQTIDYKNIASLLCSHKSMFILGKGSMLSVAQEGSLKIKEIGYIHSEAYGGNALRHGPYAIIKNNTPIVFINPYDTNFNLMNNTVEEVKSRKATPIIISDNKNVSRHTRFKIIVPKNDVYKGILHNIPLQMIAYYMAIDKGHNPDMPKNLSKCVSV